MSLEKQAQKSAEEPYSGEMTKEEKDKLEALRLPADYGTVGVKKQIVNVPVKKPDKFSFVRTHPLMHMTAAIIQIKALNESYLVAPEVCHALEGEWAATLLVGTITRQGGFSLWPIRLPGPDGRHDSWNAAALEAAKLAEKNWVRVSSNMAIQSYDVHVATVAGSEPVWPELSFAKLLDIAFKQRVVKSVDDDLIRRLRGEI